MFKGHQNRKKISLGALISCSVTKEDTKTEHMGNQDAADEDRGNVPEPSEEERAQTESIAVDNSFSTLTYMKEGEQEQKQATLAVGNGYSLYLPDDEQWHLSGPDLWKTDINEKVTLWITHFEDGSVDSVNQKLEDDGYAEEDSHKWWKQEGDLIYHVEQKVFENNIWGIFCSYPIDFEEGWGREFPVIADTFALSDETGNHERTNDTAGTGEYLGEENCQIIRTILDGFAEAYFHGDVDAVGRFLASTYEGEIDVYEGTGAISDLTVKGLSDADEKKIENGKCNVSMEFRDSDYEDMFLYLTVILVKEEEGWKIEFYGLEG